MKKSTGRLTDGLTSLSESKQLIEVVDISFEVPLNEK